MNSTVPAKECLAQSLILASECLSGLAIGTHGIPEMSFQGDFISLAFEERHHSLDPGSGSISIMENLCA